MMSGNGSDRPSGEQPDLPEVNIPPMPDLPPLPWEEQNSDQAAQGGQEAGSPQPGGQPGDPAAAQQPPANPYGAPAAPPQQPADPYAQPADPYAQRAAERREAQQAGGDPYAARAQQAGQQQNAPYGQQNPPYGQQNGAPGGQPSGQPPYQPYAQQPAQPAGQQPGQPAGQQPYQPYAQQQPSQPTGQQGGGYGQQPPYGGQGAYGQAGFAQEPPRKRGVPGWVWWIIGVGVVVVIAAIVVVSLVINSLPGGGGGTSNGGGGGDFPNETAGSEADYRLSDAGPSGLEFAWNADGVTSGDWKWEPDDGYGGVQATSSDGDCTLVGYVDSAPAADSSATDDEAASTADFAAYLDQMASEDSTIEDQPFEADGTVAVETPEGSVELQAYDVTLQWSDPNRADAGERWYWRTFADDGASVIAYTSCGDPANLPDAAAAMAELTLE